jgi:hypothetical protein
VTGLDYYASFRQDQLPVPAARWQKKNHTNVYNSATTEATEIIPDLKSLECLGIILINT